MKVVDFVTLDKGGLMYRLVDATLTGCITHPQIIVQADKNVVSKHYGEKDIVGFDIATKKTLILYVK